MKVSDMIKNLQFFIEEHGDLECWYATDDEGNNYSPVYFSPSCYYVNKYGDMYQLDDIKDEDPEDIVDLEPVCIVN